MSAILRTSTFVFLSVHDILTILRVNHISVGHGYIISGRSCAYSQGQEEQLIAHMVWVYFSSQGQLATKSGNRA